MSELRKDPITGGWVIVATERGKRPQDYKTVRGEIYIGICPFCEGHEDMTPEEILASRSDPNPNGPGWKVRVVNNRYPALRVEGDVRRTAEGMYDLISGVGAHEVIIETPEHRLPLPALPQDHLLEVLKAYRQRMVHHALNPRIEYILIFKNHGPGAGASLEHPHTQLIATPIVPIKVTQELRGAEKYYSFRDRCVFCDIIRQEEKKPLRVVAETSGFLAICPYASRFPFEIWILPREHSSHFEELSEEALFEFAGVLKECLGRLYNALDDPAYNFMLHVAPPGDIEAPWYHWHLEIIPKLTTPAGFEWGSGFYINPTPPEDASQFLRQVNPLVTGTGNGQQGSDT